MVTAKRLGSSADHGNLTSSRGHGIRLPLTVRTHTMGKS